MIPNLSHLGLMLTPGPAGTMELSLRRHGPKIRKHGKVIPIPELKQDVRRLYELSGRAMTWETALWVFTR